MNAFHQDFPIVFYQLENGETELQVKLHNETLWLSLRQIVQLFGRDKSVISRHLKNIFKEEELERNAVVANFATTAEDNKVYQVEYYNLDAIISVGYRVNSKQGTKFRQWSNKVLKEHIVQGFSLNEKRLQENGITELIETVELLHKTLRQHDLLEEKGDAIINVILTYAKTWSTLAAFDQDKLLLPKNLRTSYNELLYEEAKEAIELLKRDLINKKEATALFGQGAAGFLIRIIASINQTFDGKHLYKSFEEKAANLLYLIIKDHPFADGNKRIASFLFLLFLRKNNIKCDFTSSTLVALALLVAESHPNQKELMIRLIVNLISP